MAGKRSVLLIIADDWSPIAGCYGHPKIKTPHIDAFASQASVFDRAYCTSPSCAASRACLLTGQHSHTHGQYGHCHDIHGFRTHHWIRTVPAVLREAGMKSALFGKTHILPDHIYPFDARDERDSHSARTIAERAGQWLASIGDEPFYLHVAGRHTHRKNGPTSYENKGYDDEFEDVGYRPEEVVVPPWLPDVPDVRADLAEYYRAITRHDRFVGELLRMLRQSGRQSDTMVMLLSDHGMPFPAAKASPFDAGHHCPLIVSRPGDRSQRTDAIVSWLDLAPTIYDWMQVPLPLYEGVAGDKRNRPLPGRSLMPVLDSPSHTGFDHTFWSHSFHEVIGPFPYRVLRERQFKFIQNCCWQHPARMPLPTDLFQSATWQAVLRDGHAAMGARSLQRTLYHDAEALFDTDADPLETKNLVDDPAYQAIVAGMRTRLIEHRRVTADPWLEVDFQLGRGTGT